MKSKTRVKVCLLALVMALFVFAGLVSCGESCEHEWQAATCQAPKTCKLCSATEGSTVGHAGGTATCTAKAVCDTCKEPYGELLAHTYTAETVKDEALKTAATCESAAVYYKSCACGAVSTNAADTFESGEPASHVYDQSVVKAEALKTAGNCQTKPVYYKSCACGAISTSNADVFEGSAVAHVYDQTTVDETTLKAEATCTGAAVYYKSCSCGAISTDAADTFTFGDALPHTYDKETVKAGALKDAATCESAAVYYKSCACGAVSMSDADTFESGDPAPHVYDQSVVKAEAFKDAATCTHGDVYYKSCVCGVISTNQTEVFENGSALPHDHVMTEKPATCHKAARRTYLCACGDTYYEDVGDALGHDVSGLTPVETLVPGTTCEYVQTYTCQRSDCGETVEGDHVFHHTHVASISTPATCKADGVKTLTCVCGDVQTAPIPMDATGHKWEKGTVSGNERTDSCSVCGETKKVAVYTGTATGETNVGDLKDTEIELNDASISLGEGVVDAIGDDKKVTVSAEKTEDEAREELLTPEQLAQVGDNPIYNFTIMEGDTPISQFGEDNYVTITLPYELAVGEDVDSIAVWFINDAGELESIKATYNNGFVTFKTNHFSYYTVTRLTPAERCALYGHNYATTTVAGSCTKDGYDLHVCVRCHDTYKDNLVVAQGHKYTETTVPASCTTDGHTLYDCDNCAHSYQVKLAATGHSYVEEDAKAATCSALGYKKYGCTVCDAEYTETYAKVAHQLSSSVVDATCEENGYTLNECDKCDYSYKSNYTPATGHAYGEPTWSWADDRSSATATLVCEHDDTHVLVLQANVGVTVTHGTCSNFVRTEHTAAISHGGRVHKDMKSEEKGTPNHQFSSDWKHDKHGHWHFCSCGAKEEVLEHVFTNDTVTKAPTCVADGESTAYCTCGETRVTVLPATGEHDYADGVCKDCGQPENNNKYLTLFGSLSEADGFALRLEDLSFEMTQINPDLLDELKVLGSVKQLEVAELCLYVENGMLHGAAVGSFVIFNGPIRDAEATYTFKALIEGDHLYMLATQSMGGANDVVEIKASLDSLLNEMGDVEIDEEMMDALKAFCEETVAPVIEALALGDSALANELVGDLLRMIFTFEDQADGTCLVRLDYEKISALNEDLATLSVAALVDKYFGDGTFDAVVEQVLALLNMKVSEIPAYLEDKGVDVEALIAEIDAFCVMTGAPADFSIGDMIYAEEMADVTIGMLLSGSEDDSYLEPVNETVAMLREAAVYQLIAGENAAAVKDSVAGVIGMISDSVSLTLTADKAGALRAINLAADAFSVEQDETTVSVDFSLTVTLNGRIDVKWSDIVDRIESDIVLPEEGTLSDEERGQDYEYGHTTLEYQGVTYEAYVYGYDVYRTDHSAPIAVLIQNDCAGWRSYELSYAVEYYSFEMAMLTDPESDTPRFVVIDPLTDEMVEILYTETEGVILALYDDGTEKEISLADAENDWDLYTLVFGEPQWKRSSGMDYVDYYYNAETKAYAYESQHDLDITYTLKGETCEDGYTVKEVCKNCVYIYERDRYGCQTEMRETSLADYGMCGGIVREEYCSICDRVVGAYADDYECKWEYVADIEGGHVYHCQACDAFKMVSRVSGEKDEDCLYAETETCVYILNEKEIYRYECIYYFVEHVWERDVQLNGESCEDGYTIVMTCKDCGASTTLTGSDHNTYEVERVDLTEYGACYGEIVHYACACGQVTDLWVDFCGYEWTDNQYVDEEGHTVYVEVCTCPDCGIRRERSYYAVDGDVACEKICYYTNIVTMDGKLVHKLDYVRTETEHSYLGEGVLMEGATSCEDGVIITYTCKDCGDSYSDETYWHRSYEKEKIELGSVCGGYAVVTGCACGEDARLSLENSMCELDQRYDKEWDGVACIPDGTSQFTTDGWYYFYNDFYTYTCAVTDPEACAYKIRYADYWVAEDGCTAIRYQVYQFGYDETTGACDKEIVIKGNARTYHAYTETVTENGRHYDCADCGSYYTEETVNYDYPVDGTGITELRREIACNALDNGRDRYYERVNEQGFFNDNWIEYRSYYKRVDAEGVEFWEEYVTEVTDYVGPFGENGYERVRTYKNSDGAEYVKETVACVFYRGHQYTIYNCYNDGYGWWERYDFTYSFENGCVRIEKYSNGNGETWESVEDACVYNQYITVKVPTCTQDGLEGWVCDVCEKMSEETIIHAKGHDWVLSSMGIWYCHTCGLENENGADGAIVLEDLTAAYGNGEDYVVGYCDRKGIGFTHYVSLVFADGTEEIVLTEVAIRALEDVRAYAFSKAEVEALALALGYESDAYDVRFAFVPYGAEGDLDYAITFAEAVTVPDVIVGETSFKAYIGYDEAVAFTICPEEDAVWTFTACGGYAWAYADLYDAEGNWLAGGNGYDFTMECELQAGETYTLKVQWDYYIAGYLPLVFTCDTITES